MKKFFRKRYHGATLVELLIYMGVLVILVGALSTLFVSALDVQLESSSTNSLDRDGEYLLARLNYDIHRAQSITLPVTSGVQGSSLQLSIGGVNYTYSIDSNNNMQYSNNLGTFTLNSYDTRLSNFSVMKISNVGGTEDSVQISFTLTSRIAQQKGIETRNFRTTIAKRQI